MSRNEGIDEKEWSLMLPLSVQLHEGNEFILSLKDDKLC